MLSEEVLNALRGKNVLVTGGTGMVGRQIVERALDAGAHVRVASLDEVRPFPAARYVHADLTDPRCCDDAVRDIDFVYHVAGIKGSVEVTKSKPASFFVPLLLMTANVLEASRKAGVRRLVYTSSIGAYPSREEFREDDAWDGDPMDTFPGWAKRMGELQIRAYREQYGLDAYSVVRLTNVYGPGDNFDPKSAMVVGSLIHRIESGEDPLVVWGDGSAVREFAYSGDIAEGILLALHHGTGGEVVNLGTGRGTTIRELVETLSEIVPFTYAFDASKPSGFARRVMDITRARKTLGYEPSTSLRDGLEATLNWYRDHVGEHEKKVDYFRESA